MLVATFAVDVVIAAYVGFCGRGGFASVAVLAVFVKGTLDFRDSKVSLGSEVSADYRGFDISEVSFGVLGSVGASDSAVDAC